jgi:hypothetical protein
MRTVSHLTLHACHRQEELDAAGEPTKPTKDFTRAYCLLAKQELGLTTYPIEETVRATGTSYLALGLVKAAAPKL